MTLPVPSPSRPVPLMLRHDTLLGVCQGLGEDLGVNPNWFRIAFSLAIFLDPAMVIGAYCALGVIVAASRFIFPVPNVASVPKAAPPLPHPATEDDEAVGVQEKIAA